VSTSGLHHVGDVLLDQRIDVDLLCSLLKAQYLLGLAHLAQILDRVNVLLAVHDHHLIAR
jgi:hypothetical protein